MAGKLNGILLIDKPAGWTSHDVVAKLRGITGERRVGHSGTLDPIATGLLVVFFGRATRAVEFAEADRKRYEAALRLGIATDTQDITGTVLSRCGADIPREVLDRVLTRFSGEQMQMPPMYSAIKRNGRKLYEIARRGGEAERTPRKITVFRMACVGEADGDFLLEIECSKGTYIRTLCNDIGAALGCGGCMAALRRTAAGRFSVSDAHSLGEVAEHGAGAFILPTDVLFEKYPAVTIDAWAEKRVRVGADIPFSAPDGEYRVYSEGGEFLMLGGASGGTMATIKSFFEV